MVDDWYTVTTPPAASGSEAFAAENGTSGLGWIYTDGLSDEDDDFWFYLTNVRANGKVIARGVPFGYNKDNASEDSYVAKSIKSKTYLFNTYGEMQTGLVQLTDSNFNQIEDGKGLKPGYYYFNENEGSVEGQMMTGKVTVEEDSEDFYYCFDKNGTAYTNAVKNGVLYGVDGKRIQAEDGNKYEIVKTTTAITFYDKKVGNEYVVIPADSELLVNASGKIKTANAKVTIEDTKYQVTFDYTKQVYTVKEIAE